MRVAVLVGVSVMVALGVTLAVSVSVVVGVGVNVGVSVKVAGSVRAASGVAVASALTEVEASATSCEGRIAAVGSVSVGWQALSAKVIKEKKSESSLIVFIGSYCIIDGSTLAGK